MAWPLEAGFLGFGWGYSPPRKRSRPRPCVGKPLRPLAKPYTHRGRQIKPPKLKRGKKRPRKPRVLRSATQRFAFRNLFVGTYRVGVGAEYRFYRSNTGPPLETDTPFDTAASLPHTPTDTYPNGTWYVSVSLFNGILDSGFLPLGPNGETYIRLEVSGGVVLGVPPQGPVNPSLELRPGGVVRVKAFYFQTDALRASEWAITYTTNGATPGTPPGVAPTVTSAMPAGGAAVLEYDLPAQLDGTTVKVRVQTRRDDGGTWRYSENSVVLTAVADAAGPVQPLVIANWPGRLPEGV
jgi:hypothetical protein